MTRLAMLPDDLPLCVAQKALNRTKKARNTPASQGNIDNFSQTAHFVGAMSKSVLPQKMKSAPSVTITAMASKLRAAGLRPTRQRVAIACLLFDGRHRHVTAESLTSEINASGMHVAGGTVYNTLNQFTDAGFLRRVTVHNEYSLFDTNVEHHYHIFNEENSELVDLEPSEIDIKIPKKFSKSQIKKIDLVVKI